MNELFNHEWADFPRTVNLSWVVEGALQRGGLLFHVDSNREERNMKFATYLRETFHPVYGVEELGAFMNEVRLYMEAVRADEVAPTNARIIRMNNVIFNLKVRP